MKMKKSLFKSGWILAISMALLVLIPLTVSAALPENITIESKSVSLDEPTKTPSQLSDGELYVHTSADTSLDLSSTNFNISMSALGQQYKVTTTSTQRYNIVFVLDVSNSMDDGNRISNMVGAANDAIDTLAGDNKIGIVSFATDSIIERGLSTKPLDLSQTSSTDTSGATDIIKINLRSNYYLGGTNIQSALNRAYGMLSAANDADAVPVIILLSDGAPTYYYSNLTTLSTGSTGRTGDGTQTSNSYSGYTIMQAAYLKTQMDDLQIYTVPFCMSSLDSYYNLEVATLNPTSANISAASGLSSTLATIKGTLPASIQSAISYQYPDASYSATDSASSLGSALTNIISNMLLKKPITETTVAGVLNNASYVTLTYTIGDAYKLVGNTMEIVLNNQNYNFDLYDGTYVYNPATSSGIYKQSLNNIVLTLSGKTVTWKIPASLLPCNTPEGVDQVLASPITLNFEVQLDESNAALTSGTYETNSSCTATYLPNTDDPFYYPDLDDLTSMELGTNTTAITPQTTYYQAMYPSLSSGYYSASNLPTLTGFGTGSSSGSVTYIASPSNVTVTACADYSGTSSDNLTVSYGGQSIPFNTITTKTATATFSKNSSGQYTVSNFNDGISSFADATVTAISGTNVTVSYDSGKRSVTFIGVPNIPLAYTTAIFTSTSSYATTSRVSVKYFYPNGGSDVHSSCSVSSVTSTGSGKYTIVVRYNGLNYTFTDVTFTYVSYKNYNSPTKTANETGYGTVSDSQVYYWTSASKTVDVTTTTQNYSLVYANGTLTVKAMQNGVLANYAVHTQGANTTITSDGAGGYTVTEISSDGTTKTVTHYAVNTAVAGSTSTSTLSVTSYTMAGPEWAAHSGVVSLSLNNTGLLTLLVTGLSGDQYITSATLKSMTGTDMTTATSSGQAYVILTFTTTDPIKNLDITLNDANSNNGDFSYIITAAKTASGTSILTNGDLPITIAAGTYKITLKTTITYADASDKPSTYNVNFDTLTFALSSGSSTLTLAHAADFENQQVKVVLIPPSAH